MKHLALIAAITLGAAPAMAQTWTTQQFGNQTHYSGTDQNGGMWTGHAEQFGDQTRRTFHGPDGTTVCRTQPFGSQMRTTCY